MNREGRTATAGCGQPPGSLLRIGGAPDGADYGNALESKGCDSGCPLHIDASQGDNAVVGMGQEASQERVIKSGVVAWL